MSRQGDGLRGKNYIGVEGGFRGSGESRSSCIGPERGGLPHGGRCDRDVADRLLQAVEAIECGSGPQVQQLSAQLVIRNLRHVEREALLQPVLEPLLATAWLRLARRVGDQTENAGVK